ncbi:MAG: LexA family protein [Planctomycetota bacterium]
MKRRTILEAVCYFLQRGDLPTVREIGDLIGLQSSATVHAHLKALAAAGLVSLSGKSRGVRLTEQGWQFLGVRPLRVATAAREIPRARGIEPLSWKEAFARAGRKRPAEDIPPGGWTKFAEDLPVLGKDVAALRVPLVGAIAAGKPFESFDEGFFRGQAGAAWQAESGAEEGAEAAGPELEAAEGPALAVDPRMFVDSGEVFALRVEGDSMIQAGILDGDYVIIRRQDSVEDGEIAAVLVDGEGTLKRWHSSPRAREKRSRPRDAGRTIKLAPANERFDPIYVTETEGRDVIVLGKYVGLVRGNLRLS